MKRLTAITTACLIAGGTAHAQGVEVFGNGSLPASAGSSDYFVGNVTVAPMAPANEASRHGAGMVTFAPEARTAWHTHPVGQMLIITQGKGWVQSEGGPRHEVAAGDTVWIAADINHWHGATDTTPMSHIALTYENADGENVVWGEQVTNEDYAP